MFLANQLIESNMAGVRADLQAVLALKLDRAVPYLESVNNAVLVGGSPVLPCRPACMTVGMSFGQPCFPQSLPVSRQVISTSIMAKNAIEIRNAQGGV